MESFHILMVCTGNICRSPMAEGMLRHRLPQHLERFVTVSSAGTDALHGNMPMPFAVQTMRENYGIDISSHRARRLNRSMILESDLVLVMERDHLKTIRSLQLFGSGNTRLLSDFDASRPEPFDIPDPMGGNLDRYTASAKQIENCLGGVRAHIEENIGN